MLLQISTEYDTIFSIGTTQFFEVKGEYYMAVSYNKLWKLLVDKKMSKADLRKSAGLAPNTMTKLRRDEQVAMSVLERICMTLDADFGDIIQYIKDESKD